MELLTIIKIAASIVALLIFTQILKPNKTKQQKQKQNQNNQTTTKAKTTSPTIIKKPKEPSLLLEFFKVITGMILSLIGMLLGLAGRILIPVISCLLAIGFVGHFGAIIFAVLVSRVLFPISDKIAESLMNFGNHLIPEQ